MTSPSENTKDILVIYEEEAEEWALYLKSLFKHIVKEEGILLYNLETLSFQHLESHSLSCYRCKLLILSNGLLKCLDQKRRYFLVRVLEPPARVVILLCGVENSDVLHEILTLDQRSQEISTDQDPEEYLSIVAGVIQQDEPNNEEVEESLSCIYETVLADDYRDNSEVNLQLDEGGVSVKTDVSLETEVVSETLETTRPSVLVLPGRISCENPDEIFILLRDEITETVEIEFITDNRRIRTQPAFWNQKVRCMKALDFPAGPVNVNVYCGGVIKAVTQIEYYTAVEEIERIFKKAADPIAFACQAFKFSSVEKLDSTLTFLLKSKESAYEFSAFPNEVHHQQANSYWEELPTLLHCAAKFGLKNLATLLLQCPEASQACRITNKHGENPAHIAGKHGHNELQKIIQELSINTTDNEDGDQEKEEEGEDGIYVAMLSSGPHITSSLTDKQSTGDQCGVRQKAWEESGKRKEDKEEEKEEEAEEVKGVEEKKDEENNSEEKSCSFDDNNDNLYASIPDDDPEVSGRDSFFLDKPPLPPRAPSPTIKQDYIHYFSQARKWEEDKKERDETSGHLEVYGGEEDKSEDDEEDPYTFADLDDSVYDMILASDEEKRKQHGSFIINRPPAPAPRPLSSPKEENTPYIVQVFQQKGTRSQSNNEKMYCAFRKQDRVRTDTSTYTTLKHSIPSGQEELILLQEQVKKGAITVDEALEKFKQWQNEKSRLEVPQQEKVRQLRDCIIGKRPEEAILYDKITIEHHPDVCGESLRFRDLLNTTPFNKQSATRNPPEKEQVPKDH
ncbi:B-cell scaffold protein with ankyrin repeats isoform X1 [Gopherus evgoodei]|uniref:B-cell scaffold protein with ankyrin repeats isoform X1 n=1 Tax=Gopherus evgoodei TaxID=1825980 RepID=UPI0011CF3E5A|nr:B-cell scaffold protein with ankyrin repeats isoform X1 [Gopherus evgoodei]XP_030420472.1 B-cell scaffold protein with ankyrin repeats isoform X1 [Gopherus evgoodei]